ncbi:hypothetical protein K7432_015245, partial [Basidiobolus ranarum]
MRREKRDSVPESLADTLVTHYSSAHESVGDMISPKSEKPAQDLNPSQFCYTNSANERYLSNPEASSSERWS